MSRGRLGRTCERLLALRHAVACAGALALLASSAVGADAAAEASKEFDRGAAAFARRDYAAAADAFVRAFRLAPHGAAIYNAALAWEAAGERARAADAYARALELGGLSRTQDKDARARLGALEPLLGRIDVEAPAGTTVSIAHADKVATPARVRVEPGEHAVRAWLPDGRAVTRVVTAGTSPVAVRLDEAPSSPPEPAAPRAPEPAPAPAAGAEDTSSRTFGWVAIGASVVLSGTAIVLGTRALGARDEFEGSQRTSQDAHDRAASYRLWTNVALGGALVTGGVGAYLVLTSGSAGGPGPGPGQGHAQRGELRFGMRASGVVFEGRF